MTIILIVILLLMAAPAQANHTALHTTATALSPGQYAIISNATGPSGGQYKNPITYTDSMAWDPINHKFVYCGEDEGQHFYEVPIYDEATNVFSRGVAMPGNAFTVSFACAHQYDATTIDTSSSRMYFSMQTNAKSFVESEGGTFYDMIRYNITAGTWTTLPAQNVEARDGACCLSIAYFPERLSVVYITSQGHVLEFKEATQAWTAINLTQPANWNQASFNFAEYSQQNAAVFFGTSTRMWKLASNGTITRMADPPAALYGGGWGGNITADPVTGQLVAYVPETSLGGYPNYNLASYNPATNTWSAVQTNVLPKFAYPNSIGGITSAPVSNYGVIVSHICGIFSGVCDGRILVYKHTASAPDTTPPTTPTSLVATPISSTQINLTWTASTDNIGVTGYKVERCTAAACVNFVEIATPSINSYNNTGLTASTLYRYRVRATDAAGNLSTYSTIAQATTNASGGLTPDQDFANRCAGPGVVRCLGFDVDNVDVICCSGNGNPAANLQGPITASHTYAVDAVTKKSGKGALKFHNAANGDPSHVFNYSCCGDSIQPPSGWIGNFANQGGHELYFQYSIYMDDGYINGQNYWVKGSKILLLHQDALSCGDKEITMNTNGNRLAHGYFVCGGYGWNVGDASGPSGTTFDTTNGGSVYLQQGLTLDCHYGTRANCLYWQPNKWQTVLLRVKTPTQWRLPNGTGGTADGELDVWYAVDGGAYIQTQKIRGLGIFSCVILANCATEAINNFTLSFHTNDIIGGTTSPVESNVWFDEVIVSQLPIPAPGTVTPDTTNPTVAITSPIPPTTSTTTSPIAVSGTATDNVSVTSVTWTCIQCVTKGGTATSSPGTSISWLIPALDLTAGTNTLNVVAHDAAGNVSTAATLTIAYAPSPVYWASPTGSGATCGTTGNTDPKSGYTTFAKGLTCVSAGNTLMLKGGTYTDTALPLANSGTSFSNPITVRNAPGETVTLTGNNPIDWYGGTFHHLIVDGSDGTTTRCSATTSCTTRIIFDFTGTNNSVTTNLATFIRFKGIELKNSVDTGLQFSENGNGHELINSKIHNNGDTSSSGVPQDHGVYQKSRNGIIDGNEIYSNCGAGVHAYIATDNNANDNLIVRNNSIHDNGTCTGQMHAVIVSSGVNIRVYNNLIYSNDGPGITVYNIAADGAQIYNNTVYNNTQQGAWLYPGPAATGTIWRNNIFSANVPNVDFTGGTVTSSNNLCSTALTGCAATETPGTTFANPAGFNFALRNGSVAINQGTNLSSFFTTDITGLPRPATGAWEIGAYEFIASIPPVVTIINPTSAPTLGVTQPLFSLGGTSNLP